MRVVSLLPAGTEIVAALGGAGHLVGISHECDYPRSVQGLPRVTSTPIDPLSSGAAIDAEVRRLRDAGLPSRLSPHSFRVATVTDLLTQGVPLDVNQPYCLHCQICPGLRFWKSSPVASSRSSPIVAYPVLGREVNKRFRRPFDPSVDQTDAR